MNMMNMIGSAYLLAAFVFILTPVNWANYYWINAFSTISYSMLCECISLYSRLCKSYVRCHHMNNLNKCLFPVTLIYSVTFFFRERFPFIHQVFFIHIQVLHQLSYSTRVSRKIIRLNHKIAHWNVRLWIDSIVLNEFDFDIKKSVCDIVKYLIFHFVVRWTPFGKWVFGFWLFCSFILCFRLFIYIFVTHHTSHIQCGWSFPEEMHIAIVAIWHKFKLIDSHHNKVFFYRWASDL